MATSNCAARPLLGFLLLAILGLAARGEETPESGTATAPPARLDSLGDPLPRGALRRFGTSRLHASSNVGELALSPDGKTLVTIGDELTAWDTITGKAHWMVKCSDFGLRLPAASYSLRPLAFKPDGTQFFTPGREGAIIAWNTLTGERQEVPIASAGAGEGAPILNRGDAGYRAIDVSASDELLTLGSARGVVVVHGSDGTSFEIANRPNQVVDFNGGDRLRFGGHGCFVRIAPNEKSLAIVTSESPQTISIVDAADGHELRRIPLEAWLVRLTFSPDGKRIFTTERDSSVRCYDTSTGERRWSQTVKLSDPHENYTSAIAVSPDGQTVVAAATDTKLYLFNAADGHELGQLTGHGWYPWALAFTADSRTLFSSGWDGAIRRWDIANRKQLPLPVGYWGTEVSAASPDGCTLAFQDGWGVIHLVDAGSGQDIRTLQLPNTKYSQIEFSPDGRLLAAGGGTGPDNQVSVWDVARGALKHRWFWPRGRDPKSTVESIRFSPDGKRLAAAVSRQSAAYLWDLASNEQVAQLTHDSIYGLSFAPDGELVTVGWDSTVRFWDGEAGTLRDEVDFKPLFPNDDELRMYTVIHAPEGKLMATVHLQGMIRIWQNDPMTLCQEFKVPGRFVYGAASFSPDGLWLATGGSDGSVTLWDPTTGEKVWDARGHGSHVYQVSFGRDSRTLLTGGDDGQCYQWDLRPTEQIKGQDPAELWGALSSDDSRAAYEAMRKMTDLGDQLLPLLAHKLKAVKVIVDPDYANPEETVAEKLHREKSLKRLAAGDDELQSTLTVRRAISVLGEIGSPVAIELLKELAASQGPDDMSRLASAALKRASRCDISVRDLSNLSH